MNILKMTTAQITAIAQDTTVTARIGGKVRSGIPTIFNAGQPPVLQELWVFLISGDAIVGLGSTYNYPSP